MHRNLLPSPCKPHTWSWERASCLPLSLSWSHGPTPCSHCHGCWQLGPDVGWDLPVPGTVTQPHPGQGQCGCDGLIRIPDPLDPIHLNRACLSHGWQLFEAPCTFGSGEREGWGWLNKHFLLPLDPMPFPGVVGADLTWPQGCEALSLMLCPICAIPRRTECPEVSVPAAHPPSEKDGGELLPVPPCFCSSAVALSEAGICGELIGPTRKRQAKFQSSARTAGFRLNGAFCFFSSLVLVFCVAVSGS